MDKPCFRPGIGVYSFGNEIHVELYPVKKRIEFKTDELGKKVISQFNGEKTVPEILSEIRKTKFNYTTEELNAFINELDKLNLLYDANCNERDSRTGQLSRQIDYFNMYPSYLRYRTELLDTIHSINVLIIGCGGLGSAIFESLIRCGVQNLTIIDDDYVELKNLCNQSVYSLKDIKRPKVDVLKEFAIDFNPNISVKAIKKKVNEQNIDTFIQKADFVFTCADSPSIKYISKIVSSSCCKYNIPHIVGGGYSGHRGAVGMFIIPFKTLCWECYLNTQNEFKEEKKSELISPKNDMSFYPLISIVASIQVGEFFRYYTDRKDYLLTNKFSEFYFDEMKISSNFVEKSQKCKNCYNVSL